MTHLIRKLIAQSGIAFEAAGQRILTFKQLPQHRVFFEETGSSVDGNHSRPIDCRHILSMNRCSDHSKEDERNNRVHGFR